MNSVQKPIFSSKVPTVRRRVPFSEMPTTHMIKVERGLVQRSILYCFQKGYFSLIRYLLESGSANARERDNEGRNGLMYCCFIDNDCWAQNISMTLLEYDAKIEDEDHRGLNALYYAIITQRSILVRRYLASLDFNLNDTRDIHGNTCLHYACSTGNIDIVRLILDAMKRYSIDLTVKNLQGLTAYDIAYMIKHERCQNLLRNEILLGQGNNVEPTKKAASQITIESLMERRLSIPARSRPKTSNTHQTESTVSAPTCVTNSKDFHQLYPIVTYHNHQNIMYSSMKFIDPIESRHMKLKHNENLDLSLANQIKSRVDFSPLSSINRSNIFNSSEIRHPTDFAKIFYQLQTFKTSSYRKTVHPPLSKELPRELLESSADLNASEEHESHYRRQSSSSRISTSQKSVHRRQSNTSSHRSTHK